jgi:hypothetical protein
VSPAARRLLLTLAETGGVITIHSGDIPVVAELLADRLIEVFDSEGSIMANLANPYVKPETQPVPMCERRRQEWCV